MTEDPFRPRGRPWRAGPPKRLLDNPWFAVDAFEAQAPTGVDANYYVQDFKAHAVGVLALSSEGLVTLVGQWRFPFGTYSWELPEGGAPKSETPLDGAKRELREEAGLEAETWRCILTLQLSNASSNEVAFGYLATGLTEISRDLDPTEDIAVVRVPFKEALRMATSGAILDAITVAILLRAHHMAYVGDLDPALSAHVLER